MLKAVPTKQDHKDTRQLMADTKFYEGYSRWDETLDRYETWDEAVERVMNMHRDYYADKMTPELEALINEAEGLYKQKYVLGAQRALQFGGEQLLANPMRIYNCTSSYADRPEFFQEIFHILLCGAGAGFSVQKHHIAKMPPIAERKKAAKIYSVEDSIEGWADSLGVLMSSYFKDGSGSFPEYEGRRVYFDLNKIRPKGAMISGGFKAPGPEPLRRALDKIEHLIQHRLLNTLAPEADHMRLRPIDVYDIAMYAADAVLAGGVRRSATICLFSPDDEEMLNAKTGTWWQDNPQRGRSNNSAVIVRDEITREEFKTVMSKIREFGEPGFYFVDDKDFTTNPCVSGDTELRCKLNDEKFTTTIKEYVEMFKKDPTNAPLVYSQNISTGENKFSFVSGAEMTRKSADIVKIELDDGKTLRCTPDHKIFTSNRGYVEAKDLTEDDELVVV